jgi:hypothetical protein
MKRDRSFSCELTTRATLCVLGVALLYVANPADSTARQTSLPFSDSARQTIDTNLVWGEPETRIAIPKETYDSAVRWVISKAPLPVEEEIERARRRHDEVAEKFSLTTPEPEIQITLDRLVAALPPSAGPDHYTYQCWIIDDPDQDAFTLGAGRIYLSANWLKTFYRTGDAARKDRLAYLIGRELGHTALGHIRSVYQREWMNERLGLQTDADGNSPRDATSAAWREQSRRFLQRLAFAESDLESLYPPDSQFEADLFAIHLCRNAGFDLENALDALRYLAVAQQPTLSQPSPLPTGSPREDIIQPADPYDPLGVNRPSIQPSAPLRLRRLRMELDGIIVGENYGLHRFDHQTETWQRAENQSLDAVQSPIVLIHGMESSLAVFNPMVQAFAEDPVLRDREILGFQYPGDDSLARSAKFLINEVARTAIDLRNAQAICHSAGGLILRNYVEVDRRPLRSAYFLGTPHGGSNLAALQAFLEASQFLGSLRLGYDQALASTIRDGHGQISHDLLPDSLFLSHLNTSRNPPDCRYVVFRGRAVTAFQAMLMTQTSRAAKGALEAMITTSADQDVPLDVARAAIGLLDIPEEISNGDLCVTCERATLKTAAKTHDYPVNHTMLPRDQTVINDLIETLKSPR